MVVSRPVIARGLAAARLARPLRKHVQPVLRRGYASGGSHAPPSSDIPWLAGAIAVTIPGCYLLWPEKSHGDAHHGHGEHKEEHAESHDEKPDQEESSEDAQESGENKAEQSEQSQDEKSEDSGKSDDSEKKSDDKADKKSDDKKDETSDDKEEKSDDNKSGSGKKVEGVQFKGKTSAGGEDNEIGDNRKRESDSKGAYKKRIDSDYQKDLGEGDHKTEEGSPSGKSATGPSGDPGAIDTKQQGISTTPTRHSTKIDEDPDKSKKGEGAPETAKSQTSVDPKRPAVSIRLR
ncbi:hypothetical protein K461DRAFT_289056 [Myriangium duriaei CBS 260.36]|uniref:Uncharacterized protein n=1 Tax=Myriangium duriaei CBS 260.36 TaxID=1168546 RepID=A0A9P4MNX9_9PEZI|nr:hypothetical protein K461DRAFT_289056 [Myriangium duriaei CBS 260.36]